MYLLPLLSLLFLVNYASAFTALRLRRCNSTSRRYLSISGGVHVHSPDVMISNALTMFSTLSIADTTISEEDVLNVAGQASSLPDPLYAVGLAAFVFLGVAVLQLSLGDLTKEVGLLFCILSGIYLTVC
jgi:hypothetical protein